MTKLIKPVKKVVERYDYHECSKYLGEKYEYDERDYAGKFKGRSVRDDVPYLDFWHFLLHYYNIDNGSEFVMYKELMDGAETWQKEILQHYFDEFDPENTGKIRFYVWW